MQEVNAVQNLDWLDRQMIAEIVKAGRGDGTSQEDPQQLEEALDLQIVAWDRYG